MRSLHDRRLQRAIRLINSLCDIAHGTKELIALQTKGNPISASIRTHDNEAIFSWLMNVFSYQGISDAAAERYIAERGNAAYADVHSCIEVEPRCEKLRGFWAFKNCGYEKTKHLCSHQSQIDSCSLPQLPLRNGRLNQAAFSLYFFMRDVASGDLVAFIDRQINQIPPNASPRDVHYSLVPAWKGVFGVSDKVISMALATLLLSAPKRRKEWKRAGCSLIVVDSLVHNFLHRTGFSNLFGEAHPYGPKCYEPNGCFDVLGRLSKHIDARRFNIHFPSYFPRFVQLAVWRYSSLVFDVCNGNRIDDRKRCEVRDCYLKSDCSRIALKPR